MKVKSKGAFAQDTNGKWRIDTKIKVDGVWKHFKKSGYATLSSAKADFDRAKEQFIQDNSKHHKVVFFEDLVDKYSEMRKVIVDVSTQECDRSAFNIYFYPYFKGKLISNVIEREIIYDWYIQLVNNPKITNNKKSKVITRMKDLLKFAYMHEYIDAPTYQSCDVCLYQVKYDKKPTNERVVWSKDEEDKFYEAISTNAVDDLMFRLFLHCSPRLGEFLGLQPNCIDFEKRKLTIKQQVKQVNGKGATLVSRLKTNESYRSMLISESMCNDLRNYISTMSISDNQYLFHSFDKFTPMSRNTFRRKLYHYCDIAGVRRINPHASRHLQATKLASLCNTAEEIEASARRLGHSPEMFLNTYAKHTNDATEQNLLERLG